MRQEAVAEFLNKTGCNWELVNTLINSGQLIEIEYLGKTFYLRKLR